MLTNQCINEFNVNVEARRIKDRNRKTIDRRNRTNDQIVDDKLKDRLRKRKEKSRRTEAENEFHRIKNRAAVLRCRKRKCGVVRRPEDVLLNHLKRCAYLTARTDDQKEISKEKTRISHKLWRSNLNINSRSRYKTTESVRKSNVRTTNRHLKLLNHFDVNDKHRLGNYKQSVFNPRFECRFISKRTMCFGDVLNAGKLSDVSKHLCLLPLKFMGATQSMICYWPCLVFRGVHQAIICHRKIYPLQHNIQLKLQMKLMQRSLANGIVADDRFVVLPIANLDGCFPKTMSTKVLYDVVDLNSLHSEHYWKTVITNNGEHFQGGNNIYRLIENLDVVRAYVRKATTTMSATTVLGKSLFDSITELNRLSVLK